MNRLEVEKRAQVQFPSDCQTLRVTPCDGGGDEDSSGPIEDIVRLAD